MKLYIFAGDFILFFKNKWLRLTCFNVFCSKRNRHQFETNKKQMKQTKNSAGKFTNNNYDLVLSNFGKNAKMLS